MLSKKESDQLEAEARRDSREFYRQSIADGRVDPSEIPEEFQDDGETSRDERYAVWRIFRDRWIDLGTFDSFAAALDAVPVHDMDRYPSGVAWAICEGDAAPSRNAGGGVVAVLSVTPED